MGLVLGLRGRLTAAAGQTFPVLVNGYDTAQKRLTGRAPANAVVTIRVNGSVVGTSTANASGTWAYIFTTAPADGATITAEAVATSPGFLVAGGAPVILSASTGTVPENQSFSFTLTANRTVTWTKQAGNDGALFTLSQAVVPSTTATLQLGPRDFEAPGDLNADNVYLVSLRATDTAGKFADQLFSLTVQNVSEGALPTITPTTGTVDNAAPASTVVLDLPALAENETRSYVAGTGPSFATNSAGDLIRGLVAFSPGTATGKVRQSRDGTNTDTDVTITLTDAATAGTPLGLLLAITRTNDAPTNAGQPLGLLLALTSA